MLRILRRSLDVYRAGGPEALIDSSKDYISNVIENNWLKHKYKSKYGDLAPRPDERLWVDPGVLDYSIRTSDLLDNSTCEICDDDHTLPNYGILGGSWDLYKVYWRDSGVWGGLAERFEEGKPWKETSYYQIGMEMLRSNKNVEYMNSPQTAGEVERYLEQLDRLYEDMRDNGYDPSSVISVHIGRNGEWMVGHGNHRRTLARIVDVDSIPVQITYRHTEWQNIRQRVYNADSADDIRDIEDYLDHPDIPNDTLE